MRQFFQLHYLVIFSFGNDYILPFLNFTNINYFLKIPDTEVDETI